MESQNEAQQPAQSGISKPTHIPPAPKEPKPHSALHDNIKTFLLMNLGSVLVAIGVYFFKFPNHFSVGGVSGLSILLGQLIPDSIATPATINTVLNVAFLLLGFFILDKGFGFKTVYCTLCCTLLTQFFEWFYPLSAPLTEQKLLELLFAVILPAYGAAVLFNIGASSGGTDIVAMIIKKFTGLNVGNALLVSDILIALSTFLVFDAETGLFSLLGLCLKSVLVDSAIESINRRKSFTVVTHHPDPVCKFITQDLGRGATIWQAQGAYTHQDQYIVLSALTQHQSVLLRNFLRETDPHAFILVTNSSEIFGKGFLQA